MASNETAGSPDLSGGPVVVVGIDGSDSSMTAFRWAVRYATALGGQIRAVTAWQYPTTLAYAPMMAECDFEKDATTTLHEAVEKMTADGAAVPIRERIRYGDPATVLIDEAHGADLLVVGSRGHGAFTGMLLGSTSARCAHHSPCPVLIVRGTAS